MQKMRVGWEDGHKVEKVTVTIFGEIPKLKDLTRTEELKMERELRLGR